MKKSYKILLVENDCDIRKKFSGICEKLGCTVFEAVNADAGIEIIGDIMPHLVIVGFRIPSGAQEFLEALRSHSKCDQTPVIFVCRLHDRGECISIEGVNAIIELTLTDADISKRIRALLIRPEQVYRTNARRALIVASIEGPIEKMSWDLNKSGYSVDVMSSGADAITKVVQLEPDIVILDVILEGMVSSDLVSILRQMKQMAGKPIITYSYYHIYELGREDVRQRALSVHASQKSCQSCGATEFIGRYNENTFLRKISKFFNLPK